MDYKKKSLTKLSFNESYEEIDTRLASGWYVDSIGNEKKKKYKTKEVSFTISKKHSNHKQIKFLKLFKTVRKKNWHNLQEMYPKALDFVDVNTLF